MRLEATAIWETLETAVLLLPRHLSHTIILAWEAHGATRVNLETRRVTVTTEVIRRPTMLGIGQTTKRHPARRAKAAMTAMAPRDSTTTFKKL